MPALVLCEGGEATIGFPDGEEWVYLFDTSVVYEGGTTHTLTLPLTEYPVFLRVGSELARDPALLLAD